MRPRAKACFRASAARLRSIVWKPRDVNGIENNNVDPFQHRSQQFGWHFCAINRAPHEHADSSGAEFEYKRTLDTRLTLCCSVRQPPH
jgi:hypothetical protein